MFGGGSIKLARVFGVRIGVEPSWFIVVFLIVLSLSSSYSDSYPGQAGKAFALAVISAAAFFLSVVLHELGHAVVAMRNGIGIQGIDLFLFGGVAKLERDSKSAGEEFRVAAAGPAVTLVIALVCFGVGSMLSDSGSVADSAVFQSASRDAAVQVLSYLTLINGALLVFNLIPAFPLDGGRIARAAAWQLTGDRNRATRFAAWTGRIGSYGMIGVGAYALFFKGDLYTGIWLGFIGVFLGQAARSTQQDSEIATRLEGMRVSDVMDAEPVAVPADLTLDRAEEEYFLRYGYPWFPVVDELGRLTGLVTRAAVEGLPEAIRASRTVASVMASDTAAESRLRVATDEPLEALLGQEPLVRLGAMMAVDGDGRLRGIVTADQVQRAMTAPAGAGG
jgi:Zn-dependent protease/CBS domain-containing protein